MHKGTPPTVQQFSTPNWEDIVAEIPDQSIGVWMAPFNNNVRIALTTTGESTILSGKSNKRRPAYPHAMVMDSGLLTDGPQDLSSVQNNSGINGSKKLEFIDIPHFPVNKRVHICVNIIHDIMEIYRDGRLLTTYNLSGLPEFSRDDVHILKPRTIDGALYNLAWQPSAMSLAHLRKLIA
jgi:hypothetical protein